MKITVITDLAYEFGKYAEAIEKEMGEEEQVKAMTEFSYTKISETLKTEGVLTEELEPMLVSVSEWIGNLMLAVVKNTYLYVYNYSKKKMQTNFQAYGITVEI